MRLDILRALDGQRLSLRGLAQTIPSDPRTIQRHVGALHRAGLLRRLNGSGGVVYEAANLLHFSDAEYAALPMPVRDAVVAATLAQAHTVATTAHDAGGFDREDMHLSRTRLRISEAAWRDLSGELEALLKRMDEMGRTAVGADEATVDATAILMLFERGTPEDGLPDGQAEVPLVTEDQAHERCLDLVDEIQAGIAENETDWSAVGALADELCGLVRVGRAAHEHWTKGSR